MIVFRVWIAVRREIDPLIAEKFFVNSRILVRCNTQNNPVSRLDVFLQPVQLRSFFDTRRTPRAPEVQHHNLAAKIGKVRRLSVEVQREVFGALPGHGRLAMTVSRQGKKDDNSQESRQASPGYDLRADSHQMLY